MFLNRLGRIYEKTITAFHALGSGLVLIMMVFIVMDVLGRAMFSRPLTGAPELVKVTLVALVFLGLAKTLSEGRHIRVTILQNRVSPKTGAILNLIADITGALVLILICLSSWDLMIEAIKAGEYEGAGALRVPTSPLRIIIVVCSALTVIRFVINAIQSSRIVFFGHKE